MTLGTFGSTLNDELNRLANGGTYRTMATMVDEALAAKQWANRENIIPYSTDTVGILNEIAGLGLDKRNWLDFNGVCNYIAGTTGLPAAAALRQVYNTTDLLTSQSAYYVDATAPRYNYPGYIRLDGTSGNSITIPDEAALDVTGDLDLRVYAALDNWASGVTMNLLAKWNTTGNQRSYVLYLNSDNKLYLAWSPNGTTVNNIACSVVTGITAGTPKWVRATLDVDNGAAGNTVTFFTSDNGTSWTQLGTTVVTAGVTSIFAGTAVASIGTDGNNASPLIGKVYNAQIFASLNGTNKVLDVDLTTNVTSATMNTFIATTGQLCTINGQDTVTNAGSAGSLLPTTLGSSTAADSNDPKFLDFTGTNYVYLPGVGGNNLSVPDSASLDIIGDIDLRAQVALDDWTPSVVNTLIAKDEILTQRSFRLQVLTDGKLVFVWFEDGSATKSATSSVATGITDGTTKWVRATLDVDNGASGNDVKFWTSDNGTTWTQLGATVTTAGVTSIFSGTSKIEIGVRSLGGTELLTGKVYRAQIFNGIDGTKVLDVDTSVITAGSQTSFTAVTGQTVTINRSTSGRKTVAVTQPTWLFGTDDYMEVNNRYMSSGTYLYLPGVASNSASAPDSNALDVTGDIDIRVKVALDDWTPSADQVLIGKDNVTTGTRSYYLTILAGGNIQLTWSTTGAGGGIIQKSSVMPAIVDGSTKWVRATLDVDNGAAGNDVTFYTSDNGTSWTPTSSVITTAGVTNIFAGTAALAIGSRTDNYGPTRGKFYRAQVYNGIAGTLVFDANFESSITSLNQATFTESSSNAATVTINRSGSAYRSAGITTAGYLYPGATNTFTASAIDYLNFGATDSFTVLGVWRQWATPTSAAAFFEKRDGNRGFRGYGQTNSTTNLYAESTIDDDANAVTITPTSTSWTSGQLISNGIIINRSTQLISNFTNSIISTGTSISTVGGLDNIQTLNIGRRGAFGGTLYQNAELNAIAVFRQALTDSQIRQIANYFANREVYL